MPSKPVKKKKCRICKAEFTPFQSTAVVCSVKCAISLAESKRTKEFRRETKLLKEKIKTKAAWAKEAQAAFNRFIRLRDYAEPCISCGRYHQGQYHAGHYKSVGATPELRFDEANCHKQCAPCNNHLSGNIANYRPRLVDKVGQAEVDRIEGFQKLNRYTIDDLKEIKATYNKKARELEKQNE
ncbi:MAG: recombination protein NinG [candidate division Zixibacteria bacterium]|nr:recombination protein NinG [candidate division Zixibacteria bacterium]